MIVAGKVVRPLREIDLPGIREEVRHRDDGERRVRRRQRQAGDVGEHRAVATAVLEQRRLVAAVLQRVGELRRRQRVQVGDLLAARSPIDTMADVDEFRRVARPDLRIAPQQARDPFDGGFQQAGDDHERGEVAVQRKVEHRHRVLPRHGEARGAAVGQLRGTHQWRWRRANQDRAAQIGHGDETAVGRIAHIGRPREAWRCGGTGLDEDAPQLFRAMIFAVRHPHVVSAHMVGARPQLGQRQQERSARIVVLHATDHRDRGRRAAARHGQERGIARRHDTERGAVGAAPASARSVPRRGALADARNAGA